MRSRRGLIALGTGFLASLLLLAGLASSASADDRVYFANGNSLTANRIGYANLNGSGGGNLTTTGATTGQPRGVTIDSATGRVFWTNRDATGNKISFTNLVGSGAAADLDTNGALVDGPNGAAIHPGLGRIYWANEYNNTLSSARLGGGGGNDLTIGAGAVGTPNTPMVDPASGRIYWANSSSATNTGIYYASLNGGPATPLITPTTPGTPVTVKNPHGVALDPETNRLYWANPGTVDDNPPVNDPAHVISWIDLDNPASRGDLQITPAAVNPGAVSRPIGVAIDPEERKIYWANWGDATLPGEDTIAVADLNDDGTASNARTLSTTGAAVNGTRSPALLKAPSGTGKPGITADGSELTCSQGSWAEDLPASWLYRAPHEFTYSWSRNGTAISEANGPTYTPSEPGNYTCTVTASNAASDPGGGTSQTSDAYPVSGNNPPPSGGNPPPPPAAKPSPPASNPSKPSTPPASGGSSKPSANTPLAFGSKTLTTMSVSGRRISGNGPIKVVISNKNGFQVSGTLSARAKRVKVSRGFAVGANAKKTVRVTLSKALKRMLKRQGKLSLRLTVKVNDPAGNTRTVRKNVSLRLKTG